jgi:tetratricopeptide (TPR) repeat protein
MFRWYQKAIKCYVFLADVCTSEDDRDSQLQNSRWFTRGWTLQELIAPQCVEFFSQRRQQLGDKTSLEKQISEITGISVHALRAEPLSHFTIDERMSWMANRKTTRPEDKVYSLLGIFDIHLEAIYGEGEHHATRRLLRELERYSEYHQLSQLFQNQLQFSTKRPTPPENPTWIVPFERNCRFTGREPELARLEKMLLAKHHDRTLKLAIAGLGGVGKTQLVLELLYRLTDKQQYSSVFWISAVNMDTLRQSYLDIAQKLRIPGLENEKADLKALVQEFLSREAAGQWLLVIDNADDLDMWISKTGSRPLIDYLPKSKQGAVVFTTRDKKIAVKLAQQNVVHLSAMGEDVAAQMLKNCLINSDLVNRQQDTETLLFQLTYLPLAIVQAAAYINENTISLAGYLLLLTEQETEVVNLLSEEFEDDGRYYNIRNPVAITWLISFDQIRRRDELAADYLSFMACIEPKNIPQSLLPTGPSQKKEMDAIGTLMAYSFVSKPADKFLDLHRLVHLATRNWLRKEGLLSSWTRKAIVRLKDVLPDHPDHTHQNTTVWRKYLAHASYVLRSGLTSDDDGAKSELLARFGICLFQEGRWIEAEKAFWEETETRKRMLGMEHHPDTLTSMGNLALMLYRNGRLDEAGELGMQVLETRKRVLGSEHPDTLLSMHNLAMTFWGKRQWDKAEKLQIEVVAIRKKVLGAEHLDTLISMSGLASAFWDKGLWDEAQKLEVEVMEIRKRVLGVEHPHTLTSMGNLALIFHNRSQWDEAEELEVEVVKIRKKVLGTEHPDTLESMGNLASTFWSKGQHRKAEELEVQVMEIRKRVLGAEHPDTLTSMNNVACIWTAMKRHMEALTLMAECVRLREQVLGANHPDFQSSSDALSEWRVKYGD